MIANLRLAPDAVQDIEDAYHWYEAQSLGLGDDFITSIERCLERVSEYPASCEMVYKTFRRALISRYPYAVFYEFERETVTVYAVFHSSRDPEKWKHRLPVRDG